MATQTLNPDMVISWKTLAYCQLLYEIDAVPEDQ